MTTRDESKIETTAKSDATDDAQADEQIEISPDQLIKLALEMGPLVVFFTANSLGGIFWGTGSFMVATIIALTASRWLYGRVPVMPLVTGVFVMVFGGLTLYLQNDLFIKLKPTVVNVLFASILFGGLAYGQYLLKYVFGEVMKLKDEGWHILTIRWASFFLFLALLNEVVWRTFSTDTWVWFKVWGLMPLTVIFAMAQVGVIQKYEQK